MTQVGELQGVAVLVQKGDELLQLRVISADRVGTPVGFELEPADVLIRRGLEIDGHDEADAMLSQERARPVEDGSNLLGVLRFLAVAAVVVLAACNSSGPGAVGVSDVAVQSSDLPKGVQK